MSIPSALQPSAAVSAPFRRRSAIALLALLATALLPLTAPAQTITSAVPGLMAYQGKVTNASGTPVGSGTPVNRKVIFRIWADQSSSTVNNLVYSEEQTVTISEGEFSVLLGQGVAVTGTPLGYSEAAKGPPTVTFNNSFTVFGGATRFLGVTVDDGTGSADPEVSPRQQLVTSAYSFRARFAEGLGSNGNFSVAVTDQGNFGVGIANPTFPVTTAAAFGGKVGLFGNFNYGLGIQLNTVQVYGAAATDDIAFGYGSSASMTETVRFKGNGNVGIGVANPQSKLDVNGRITLLDGGSRGQFGGLVTEAGAAMINFGINDSRFGTQNNAQQGGFLRVNTQGVSNLFQFYGRAANGTGVTEFVSITGAGNLGIGTSPSEKLHVNGNALVSGNLGVGTTSPSQKLHVNGNALTTGNHYLLDANHYIRAIPSSGIALSTYQVADGLLLQQTTGNVGIGTTSPGTKLDVNGGVRASGGSGYTFGGGGDTDGGLYSPADGVVVIRTNAGERMRVDPNGRVGIGTNNPSAILHVAGGVSQTFNVEAWGTTLGYADAGNVSMTKALGGIFDSGLRAGEMYINSDARIKEVRGKSDGAADLTTLQKIEITDYAYRDRMTHDGRPHKKVIAQQVEQVFPQAVSRSVGVIPDIFAKAGTSEGWVTLETSLKVGERVRLIADGRQEVHDVIAVEPGRFRTAFKPAGDKVFVYGREVRDFRSVDYEAIAMLNVSATQELKRQHDAEVASLRAANAELTARLATLEARDRARDAKLASIEKLLSSGPTVMARPTSAPTHNANGQD